jgi:hypothetical protein
MAQLNLTLPADDVEAIRRLAEAQGIGVSEYVRALALGERPAVDRLLVLEGDLKSLARLVEDLVSQTTRAPDYGDEIAELSRRLSSIEEMAHRSY